MKENKTNVRINKHKLDNSRSCTVHLDAIKVLFTNWCTKELL